MTERTSRHSAVLTVAGLSLILCLSPAVLCPAQAATAPVAEADAADIPRTADGKPDLSGTYDTKTLTPRARPAHFGDRLELTPEEAADIEAHWRASFERDYKPSDPDREAPPVGGVGIWAPEFTGAAGKVGGYNAFYVDIGEETFMINGRYRTSILIDPPNGQYPELSEEGEKRAADRAAFRHENTGTAWWLELETGPYDDPELRPLAERCIFTRGATGPPSYPGMYNNTKRIVQTEDHVMILVEWMHDARIIRIGGVHAPSDVRSLSGDSIGHWDGDTLVVETTNFLASDGVDEDLRVVERFSRLDTDMLLYNFTVHDPAYTAPYSGEYPWPSTDGKVYEYACHEGNYSFGNIMRGARLLEEEAAAGSGN